MDVDRPAAPSRDLNTNFVDDDELQAALARSRKAKMKKVPKLSPEEIARRGARSYFMCPLLSHVVLVAEEKAEGEAEIKIDEEEGVLTIDDTSEFVRGITLEAKPGPRVVVIPTARATSTARESPEAEADVMDEDRPAELETGEISIKEEEEMQAALMALENVYGNEDQDIKKELEDDYEVSIKPPASRFA
jgi:U4/U6.U5 tri-snRNP-associated protein 1